MSCTGTPSVMQQTVLISKSNASKMASAQNAAGTKITLAFAPVSSIASSMVLKTGTPSYSCPPLPGVTPATTLVPLSSMRPVWKAPSLPVMPCTSRRVPSSTSIAIRSPPSVTRQLDGPSRRLEHGLLRHDVLGGVLGEYLASLLCVRPVEPDDYGEVDTGALYGR